VREDERLSVIYETAVGIITRTPTAWTDYLAFGSRVYKYPFDNALLIYAQDPTATMLATKDIWQRVGRLPIAKAKNIAVCEYKDSKNTLKYLLDVSQTAGNVLPVQWNLEEKVRTPLALELSKRYNLSVQTLEEVSEQLVQEVIKHSFEQYMQDFELDIQGHFFAELPKDGLYKELRDITAASANIFIAYRCGFPVQDEDIQALSTIQHFDTVPLVSRLGGIITDVSKTVLIEIERTIKSMERSQNHGEEIESGIQRERWPVVSQHRAGERGSADRQVRPPVDGQYAKESPAAVHHPADDRDAGKNSGEGGYRGRGTSGSHIPADVGGKPAAPDRGHAGENPPPEQSAADSRGIGDEGHRADTPLNEISESEKEPQGSFSSPKAWITPLKGIPYHEGDILRAVQIEAIINKITEQDVFYRFPDEDENTPPHSMGRERFEANLENGIYRTITSGDVETYIGPDVESQSEPQPDPIGSYNIPDELEDMGTPDSERDNEDYAIEDGELYHFAEQFMLKADSICPGWCGEMADLIQNQVYSEFVLYEMFQDIEESELKIDSQYVECFAFEQKVVFRVNGRYDLEMSYDEAAEIIRSLMEIGDFTPAPPRNVEAEPEADDETVLTETGKMRIIVVPPGKPAYEAEIDDAYTTLRHTLDPSGYSGITTYEFDPRIDAVCMDDVSDDEPVNRIIKGNPIRGNFIVVRVDDEGGYISLTDEDVEKYMAQFSSVVIDISAKIAQAQEQHRAERLAEAQQHEDENSLEATFFPFQKAKRQPDLDNLEKSEPEYDPDMFVEITDIPRFDQIDSFVPVPKVIDFYTAAKELSSAPADQMNLFDFSYDADVPDASFDEEQESDDDAATEITEQASPSSAPILAPPHPRHERINYRFSEDDNLYPPGAKAKYHNNIEAIKLLRRLESEKRLATAEEQKTLARYVGWGGIASAFDSKAASWEKEYAELKLLLDEKEYSSANESVLTAYYTDQRLVRCIYQALERFGFTDGERRNILDPAMGTGNFYSVLPESLSNATLIGTEIDSITGRLARQLYQAAEVKISGFETSGIKNDSIDVAIGNVPFNDFKIYDPRHEDDFLIHDYFFVRTLDTLKPGGIAAYITSKGTMDKVDTSAREEMAKRAELIGAVRLPNDTFKSIAGTEVTTDILFFQKLPQMRDLERMDAPEWVYSDYRKPEYIRMNQYYIDHPDMILGDMRKVSGRFGPQDECIAPDGQDLYPLLEQAINKLDCVFSAEPDKVDPSPPNPNPECLAA